MNQEVQDNNYYKSSPILTPSNPITKKSNYSRYFLSTAENTQKHFSPLNDNFNKLYQEYIQSKKKRKKSEYCTDLFLSQVNVYEKEKEAASQMMSFINKRIHKKANGYYNLLLAKEDLKTYRLIKDQQLEELQQRNNKMKHKRDYTLRVWKNNIKSNNTNQALNIQLIKHKIESVKSMSQLREIMHLKEACLEKRKIRVLSAENKLRNKLIKSSNQIIQLKNRITSENQIKTNCNKTIMKYQYYRNDLILDIEKINNKNSNLSKALL